MLVLPKPVLWKVVDYCPPYLDSYFALRAASVRLRRHTDCCDGFIVSLRLHINIANHWYVDFEDVRAWNSLTHPDASGLLSRAMRLGELPLARLLLRLGADPYQGFDLEGDYDDYWENEEYGFPEHETAFESAVVMGMWDAVQAVIEFAAHTPPPPSWLLEGVAPRRLRRLEESFRTLPWDRISKETRVYLQHLKEDLRYRIKYEKETARRQREDARRQWEDARREKEDARRRREDAQRARYDVMHAREIAKRKVKRVQTAKKEVEPHALEAEIAPDLEEEAAAEVQEQCGEEDHEEEDNHTKESGNGFDAELMAAIQASKADLPVLSNDNVVLLRITRMARSPLVTRVLLESPLLSHCRARATNAGCAVTPGGACGPIFFVPCTEFQLEELATAGFELLDHHVLALHEDKDVINRALKDALPKRQRAVVSAEHGRASGRAIQNTVECADSENATDYTGPIIVEESGYATDSSVGFPAYEGARVS